MTARSLGALLALSLAPAVGAQGASAQGRPDVLAGAGGAPLDLVDLVRAENPYASFAVAIDVLGRPPRATEGDVIRFLVRSEVAGYLTIVARSPSGEVALLYPNRYAPESRIEAGQALTVPGDGTFTIAVSGPFGQEVVKAIVTPEPLVDRAAAERLWRASPVLGTAGPPATSAGTRLGGRFADDRWAATSLTVATSPRRRDDDAPPPVVVTVPPAPPAAAGPPRPETARQDVIRPEAPRLQRTERAGTSAAAGAAATGAGISLPIPGEPTGRFGATPSRSWSRAYLSARTTLHVAGASEPQVAGAAPPAGAGGVLPTYDRSIVALYRPTTGTRSFGTALAGGLFNQVRRIDPDAGTRDASGTRSLGRTYGTSTEDVLAGLQRDPDVLAAVPNYEFVAFAPASVRRVTAPPATPDGERAFWPLQWALYNGYWRSPSERVDLRWREALAGYRRPAEPVVVAVLDTGFYLDNPHLAAALWTNTDEVPDNYIDDDGNGYVDDVHGWDAAGRDNDPTDTNPLHSHGTFTATQIAGGGPGSLTYSMAPDVRLMTVRVLGGDRGGYSAIVEGIRYAAQNGARVINMSLGARSSATVQPDLERMLEAIFAEADRLGTLIVMSSGNEGSDSRTSFTYPARIRAPNAITVAAVNIQGRMTGFSNHGPNVDVAAPGDAIVGYFGPTLAVEEWNGTSMAAPFVAALAAMLFAEHPGWTPAQVRERIVSTARRTTGLDVSSGAVVDAAAALAR